MSTLLQSVIEQLVERFGALSVAIAIGEYLDPSERLETSIRWEILAALAGREVLADQPPTRVEIKVGTEKPLTSEEGDEFERWRDARVNKCANCAHRDACEYRLGIDPCPCRDVVQAERDHFEDVARSYRSENKRLRDILKRVGEEKGVGQ